VIGQEVRHTAAENAARQNRAANTRALAARQPALAEQMAGIELAGIEWVFARDGSLTAREGDAWWSGCSLPRRTAESLLKKMELAAPVACFLSPNHAGQVGVALDRMSAGQALIAIVPDARDLAAMLGCESFAHEIAGGRLWFAAGDNWERELATIFRENDGLATPGQFVRTAVIADDAIQPIIQAAQGVFARENARRSDVVKGLLDQSASGAGDAVCVIAPARFRLWNDAGRVLGEIARAAGWRALNPDDPCSTSAVALARAVGGGRALVTANAGRGDFPGALPPSTRVVCWITGPRIPQFDVRCANDVLILADPRWRDAATSGGWPAGRVHVATWPSSQATGGGAGLGVVADTQPLTTPTFDLSSQRLLWEAIAGELSGDPFALGEDVAGYVARWAGRASVAEETIDRAQFVERLIVPAYQQGLVRWLIAAGAGIKLFGRGWDQIGEFAAHWAGEVRDSEDVKAAVSSCAALVHVWPSGWAHPIDFAGRPVVRRQRFSKQQWLSEARRLSAGETHPAAADNLPALTSEFIAQLCR
jgi:hypothetical protein